MNSLNKWLYTIIMSATIAVLLAVPSLSGTSRVLAGGSNGSVYTVSDCSHVNDNQFYVGDTVKGKGSNFDSNANYEWTITKTDQPDQNTQVASGSFSLGSNVTSFCYTLWTANIVGGDTHSEFTWEVDEENVNNNGVITWKKVDSDNFYVNPAQTTPTPTATPTTTSTPTATLTQVPTATPTTDPCADDVCITPTATISPTDTPTPTPTSSGCTTNCGSSNNSSGGSSSSSSPTQAVLGANTMAATGTFETNLMNILLTFGMMVVGAGFMSYAKEKRA